MAKYLNRLKARLAHEVLRESAKEGKNWIVSRKLILETDEGDLELDKGDEVELGATNDGDLALNAGQAAVVVIADPELASKVADIVVSADELSDVKFVDKPALDAALGGEEVDDVIDKLADDDMPAEGEGEGDADVPANADEDDSVEVAELDIDQKESVEAKFEKISNNRMNPSRVLVCEALSIDEGNTSPINMATIKHAKTMKESMTEYNKFTARVSELKGSIQPGEREIALTESGKVMGAFDKTKSEGVLYTEEAWDSAEDMDNFNDEPVDVMEDPNLEVEEGCKCENVEAAVESCLKNYEESAKTGADYATLVEALENIKLKESVIAKIISTFDHASLKECVRVYDSKYGKYVAAFKESVDADNFIADTKADKRYTKRYFA